MSNLPSDFENQLDAKLKKMQEEAAQGKNPLSSQDQDQAEDQSASEYQNTDNPAVSGDADDDFIKAALAGAGAQAEPVEEAEEPQAKKKATRKKAAKKTTKKATKKTTKKAAKKTTKKSTRKKASAKKESISSDDLFGQLNDLLGEVASIKKEQREKNAEAQAKREQAAGLNIVKLENELNNLIKQLAGEGEQIAGVSEDVLSMQLNALFGTIKETKGEQVKEESKQVTVDELTSELNDLIADIKGDVEEEPAAPQPLIRQADNPIFKRKLNKVIDESKEIRSASKESESDLKKLIRAKQEAIGEVEFESKFNEDEFSSQMNDLFAKIKEERAAKEKAKQDAIASFAKHKEETKEEQSQAQASSVEEIAGDADDDFIKAALAGNQSDEASEETKEPTTDLESQLMGMLDGDLPMDTEIPSEEVTGDADEDFIKAALAGGTTEETKEPTTNLENQLNEQLASDEPVSEDATQADEAEASTIEPFEGDMAAHINDLLDEDRKAAGFEEDVEETVEESSQAPSPTSGEMAGDADDDFIKAALAGASEPATEEPAPSTIEPFEGDMAAYINDLLEQDKAATTAKAEKQDAISSNTDGDADDDFIKQALAAGLNEETDDKPEQASVSETEAPADEMAGDADDDFIKAALAGGALTESSADDMAGDADDDFIKAALSGAGTDEGKEEPTEAAGSLEDQLNSLLSGEKPADKADEPAPTEELKGEADDDFIKQALAGNAPEENKPSEEMAGEADDDFIKAALAGESAEEAKPEASENLEDQLNALLSGEAAKPNAPENAPAAEEPKEAAGSLEDQLNSLLSGDASSEDKTEVAVTAQEAEAPAANLEDQLNNLLAQGNDVKAENAPAPAVSEAEFEVVPKGKTIPLDDYASALSEAYEAALNDEPAEPEAEQTPAPAAQAATIERVPNTPRIPLEQMPAALSTAYDEANAAMAAPAPEPEPEPVVEQAAEAPAPAEPASKVDQLLNEGAQLSNDELDALIAEDAPASAPEMPEGEGKVAVSSPVDGGVMSLEDLDKQLANDIGEMTSAAMHQEAGHEAVPGHSPVGAVSTVAGELAAVEDVLASGGEVPGSKSIEQELRDHEQQTQLSVDELAVDEDAYEDPAWMPAAEMFVSSMESVNSLLMATSAETRMVIGLIGVGNLIIGGAILAYQIIF